MTISYNLEKGTATKEFELEYPEKYQGYQVDNHEFQGIIKRVLKRNPELNNFSWILNNSSNKDFSIYMIGKGSLNEEKLKFKYSENYFEDFRDLIESEFLLEITSIVSRAMVKQEATRIGICNKYYPSALRVKTQTSEMNEKYRLISEKNNLIAKLKKEIDELNKDLYLITKPIAIEEINNNYNLTEDEKKAIIQKAGLV